jgi:hypothetical protein
MAPMSTWLDAARRHPAGWLLLAQLLGVLIYPFMGESPTGRAMVSLFGLFVLVLAVWTTRTTPALTWVSMLLGLPVAVLTIVEALNPGQAAVIFWSSALHAGFYFYTTYGLIRYMFADRRITADELLATGATFTVVAWAFAYAFVALQVVWPAAFVSSTSADGTRTWVELLFLSFTNLTSTGLSDIAPVVAQARAVVMIEQVAGILYIALVVSRVVGLTLARQRGS